MVSVSVGVFSLVIMFYLPVVVVAQEDDSTDDQDDTNTAYQKKWGREADHVHLPRKEKRVLSRLCNDGYKECFNLFYIVS